MIDQFRTLLAQLITALKIGPASLCVRAWLWLASAVVESDKGTLRFNSPFVFSFPTMSVITLTVTAPGYEPCQEVVKPNYRRNVTLTIDIPLVPISAGKD